MADIRFDGKTVVITCAGGALGLPTDGKGGGEQIDNVSRQMQAG